MCNLAESSLGVSVDSQKSFGSFLEENNPGSSDDFFNADCGGFRAIADTPTPEDLIQEFFPNSSVYPRELRNGYTIELIRLRSRQELSDLAKRIVDNSSGVADVVTLEECRADMNKLGSSYTFRYELLQYVKLWLTRRK